MRSESEIQLLILEIGSIIILCCGSGSDVGGDGGGDGTSVGGDGGDGRGGFGGVMVDDIISITGGLWV